MKNRFGTLRRELGGQTFLDAPGYVVAALLSLASSMLVIRPQDNPSSPLWWVANIGALAACGAWFWVCRRFVFKNRAVNPVPLWAIALFGLSLGAIKGAGTGGFAFALGLVVDLPQAVISRVWQTAFLGLFAVLGLAVVAATLARYQDERNLLVSERVQAQMHSKSALPRELEPELRAFVRLAKSRLQKVATNGDVIANRRADFANEIREIVEQGLRPLSRRLWRREDAKLANFSFADLTRVALSSNIQPFGWVSAAYFIGSALTFVQSVGLAEGVMRSAVGVIVLVLVFKLAGLLRPKNLAISSAKFVVQNLLAAVGVVLSSQVLFGTAPGINPINITLVVFIWLLEVSFIARFVAVANAKRDNIRGQLQGIFGSSKIEAAANRARSMVDKRELATYLHGSVQNSLLSAALRIESTDGTEAELVAELEIVERLFDFELEVYEAQAADDRADLTGKLSDLVSHWQGFVEINLGDVEVQSGGVLGHQIVQVITEAISNAVRHGFASSIDIQILSLGNGATIICADNGLGPRKGQPGLGSNLFDSLAGEKWYLLSGASGGTVLWIVLPGR